MLEALKIAVETREGIATDIAEEEWDRMITLNLKSAFLCVRTVARIMI